MKAAPRNKVEPLPCPSIPTLSRGRKKFRVARGGLRCQIVAEDIRSTRPEDAHIVRALVRSAYAKWVPVIGREPLPMVADYDRAVRTTRSIFSTLTANSSP